MKPVRLVSTGVLLLLLGAVTPTYAEQEQRQQDANKQEQQAKPEKQQPQRAQKPPRGQAKQQPQRAQQPPRGQAKQQPQRAQQPPQGQAKQQPQRAQQPPRGQTKQQPQRGQQQQGLNRQQQRRAQQQQAAWQQHRAKNWQAEHRDWQQRGGYTADRIPEDRYRDNFGPDHSFRIYSNPVVVAGGYPGFLYGGFYFSVVDPWPQYWSNNWYENDDVYIDYSGDGYYLYNRRYPQDRISIGVYLNFVQPGDRRGVWLQHRARSWQSEHRTWQQRGGYNGYHIPEVRFRRYFGPGHRFRIHGLPLVIVGGYPRFQYGGFWFSIVDPWPEYWGNDWYDNDDVYIDYFGDGYYLYNRRYPGVRIAISVFLN